VKRIGNIYDQICSIENLRLADEKARKGKLRSYGVRRHDRSRDLNIEQLHRQLISGTFRTSKYETFKIKCDNGKEREIYRLPYYPDRIVHHAVMSVLEPIWVNIFTQDTYSCIKNRGIHAAVKKLQRILKSNQADTVFCLKIDVRKFYPNIDHEILKAIIRRKIKDNRLLQLLDSIVASAPGVPIGNYLSQYFANLYLTYFDHWLKEVLKVKYYFRYADDIIILSSSKEQLRAYLVAIQEYLQAELRLEVKGNYQIFPVSSRGIDFLGYVFFHTHTLLRKSIKQRFCRKVARLNKSEILEAKYKQKVCAWWGWAKYCDSRHLIQKLTKNSKYEIKFKRAS
jgi:RNA-directed DNA polymerase